MIEGSRRRCARHQADYHRRIDERRAPSSQRYPKNWPRIRKAHMDGEPLCRFHGERGETVGGQVVDHIDGDTSNCAVENLRTLCKRCHDQRTARDQAFGRRRA